MPGALFPIPKGTPPELVVSQPHFRGLTPGWTAAVTTVAGDYSGGGGRAPRQLGSAPGRGSALDVVPDMGSAKWGPPSSA